MHAGAVVEDVDGQVDAEAAQAHVAQAGVATRVGGVGDPAGPSRMRTLWNTVESDPIRSFGDIGTTFRALA